MARAATFAALVLIAGMSPTSSTAAPADAGGSAAGTACPSGRHGQVARELQRALDKATAGASPHAALLRVQCGRQVWTLASGVADVNSGRAARPDDRFRAGSIVKPAIAAVVLQLVEEGKLSLDDPITRRLPERYTSGFKDADAITVRMLLNHRSGIGEWTEAEDLEARVLADFRKVWSADEYIAMSVARGPKFRPGEDYAYNNTEYVLLGLIIENLTGKSWRDSVLERILAPVRISPMALPPPGATPDLRGHVHGYVTAQGRELDATGVDPSMAGAAGGHAFAPTTEELVRFLDALLAGRYFKRSDTLAQMQDFLPAGDATAAGPRRGYGLGLGQYVFPDGTTAIGHTGGTAGYSSFVLRLPRAGVTMAGAISVENGQAAAALVDEARKILAPQ
jgi:D-alanyl-D-alanine carboxypeptidase